MKEDVIEIQVTEDGLIKVSTPKISAQNHMSADQLLKEIETLAGGDVVKRKQAGNKTSHHHGHTHKAGH